MWQNRPIYMEKETFCDQHEEICVYGKKDLKETYLCGKRDLSI